MPAYNKWLLIINTIGITTFGGSYWVHDWVNELQLSYKFRIQLSGPVPCLDATSDIAHKEWILVKDYTPCPDKWRYSSYWEDSTGFLYH